MAKTLQTRAILAIFVLFTCIAVLSIANVSEAKTVVCKVLNATPGQVDGGKQRIKFTALFKNVSQGVYLGKINWLDVEVHGYFLNGRQETYKRKVTIDYHFSPPVDPGQSKKLDITFKRTINPHQDKFAYDVVEVKVLAVNFSRELVQ